jgi:catechol 2,3-dioxygenase-like lactoylglutathione lyase family enzyme
MLLEGVHHVTLITGDAPRNVDFYTRVLGLRLVKKTVNQDDPTVYHLFYADEKGSAGADITFFEYPGATRGRAGPGMVHTIVWRVGSAAALDFWEQRLATEAGNVLRSDDSLTFEDPEGVRYELRRARRSRRNMPSRVSTASARMRSTPTAVPACSRTHSAFGRTAITPGRRAARSAAAGTRTTPRLRAAASPVPAPSITSRGPRRSMTTMPGRSSSRKRVTGPLQ